MPQVQRLHDVLDSTAEPLYGSVTVLTILGPSVGMCPFLGLTKP